jgi:hypothetical protein
VTNKLIGEIDELLKRKPPYTDGFVLQLMICLREVKEHINDMQLELAKHKKAKVIAANSKIDRNTEILALRKKGWDLVELGKKYGITKQRVHGIVQAAKKQGIY